jgi:acetyl-CoA synthetase
MLPNIRDYDALYREFQWPKLARYNIGVDVCDRWAAAEPDRLAIIHVRADGGTDQISYGALRDSSNRLANTLRAHGIARGDRVAILLPQAPEAAVAHIAIYKLGAIALPLAILFGVDALSYRLQNAGAKAVITNAAGLVKLNEARAEVPGIELFYRRRHDAGRSGADDLHVRYDRAGEGRAACASRAFGTSARHRDAA